MTTALEDFATLEGARLLAEAKLTLALIDDGLQQADETLGTLLTARTNLQEFIASTREPTSAAEEKLKHAERKISETIDATLFFKCQRAIKEQWIEDLLAGGAGKIVQFHTRSARR